jgi:hypothetical protein
MSTMNSMRATFLEDVVRVKTDKKDRPLKEYESAEKEFKNYLRREQKVLTSLGILADLPGAGEEAQKIGEEVGKIKYFLNSIGVAPAETAKKHFHDAYEKLKSAKKTIKAKIKEFQESAKKLSQYEPLYKVRMQKLERELKLLEQRPGATSQCDDLKKMKNKAETSFKEGDPKKACEDLSDVDSKVKHGWEASNKFLEKLVKNNPDVQKAHEAWSKFKDSMEDSQEIDKQRELLLQELKKFDPPSKNTDTSALKSMTQQWEQKASKLEKEKGEVENLLQEVEHIIYGDLKMAAPLTVYEPLLSRLLEASALVGTGRFTKAKTDLDLLKTDAEQMTLAYTPSFEEWQTLAKELPKKILTAKQNATCILVTNLADRMENRFPVLQREAEETHDYQKAVAEAKLIVQKLDDIASNSDRYNAVSEDYKKLKEKAEQELQAAAEKIKALDNEKGDVSDFEVEFNKIKNAWVVTVGQPTDDSNQIMKIEDFLKKTTHPQLEKLVGDIDAILNDKDVKLKQSVETATAKKLQAEWQTLKETTTRDLTILAIKDPEKQGPLEQEFKSTVSLWGTNAKPPQELVEMLKDIAKRVAKAKEEAEKTLQNKIAPLLKEVKELQKTIKTTLKGSLLGSNFAQNFEPYFDTLSKELLECEALLETGLKSSIEKGEKMLREISPKVKEAKQDTKSKAEEIQMQVFEISKLFIPDLSVSAMYLKQYLPSRLEVLSYQFDNEVVPRVRQKSPKEALAELKKFQQKVEAAVKDAKKREQALNALKERGQKLLQAVNNLTEAPKLQVNLKKRIEAAEKPGENGEAAANVELNAIELILKDAQDPDKKAGLEQKVAAEEFEAELAKAEYEGNLDVFEKGAKKEAERAKSKADSSDVNEAAYKQIESAVKQAAKLAKAKDYQQANAKIVEATRLAHDFAMNPLGEQATSRNNLPKVNKAWHKAVSEFNRQIADLKKNIAQAGPPPQPKKDEQPFTVDLNEINKSLDAIGLSFDVTMFDKVIKLLANKATELPKRRHAKESGLRYLRNYRKILKNDPMIKHLRNEEFGTKMASALKFLDAKLNDLATNLLRA